MFILEEVIGVKHTLREMFHGELTQDAAHNAANPAQDADLPCM